MPCNMKVTKPLMKWCSLQSFGRVVRKKILLLPLRQMWSNSGKRKLVQQKRKQWRIQLRDSLDSDHICKNFFTFLVLGIVFSVFTTLFCFKNGKWHTCTIKQIKTRGETKNMSYQTQTERVEKCSFCPW